MKYPWYLVATVLLVDLTLYIFLAPEDKKDIAFTAAVHTFIFAGIWWTANKQVYQEPKTHMAVLVYFCSAILLTVFLSLIEGILIGLDILIPHANLLLSFLVMIFSLLITVLLKKKEDINWGSFVVFSTALFLFEKIVSLAQIYVANFSTENQNVGGFFLWPIALSILFAFFHYKIVRGILIRLKLIPFGERDPLFPM